MYCQTRNFENLYSHMGGVWGGAERTLCLDGEPCVVSHVGGRIWLHLEYDLFYYENFTFSFIKGTHAHYEQFEECTANILVNLFKIGFYEH